MIPARELSSKHDVDPHEVVNVGEHIEARVLQKDKEGRLILSRKRAQFEPSQGTTEKIKDKDDVVSRGPRDAGAQAATCVT